MSYIGNYPEVDAQIKTGLTTITGTTQFGTTKAGKPGSLGAQLQFRAQVIQKADVYYGAGNQGYTVEEAVAKAVADETEIYQSQYQTKGTKYFRKVEPNGTVSYPWIDARAGNVTAAEKALRDYNSLRTMVKEVGFNAVANVPNSYMTAERMEYIAQNPTAEPDALETAMVRMSPGFALHEIRNKAFAAAGRPERFGPPEVISGINFTPEQQAIINDARSSYQSKLNTVNVASGNTAVYREPSFMRAGSPLLASVGNVNPSPREAYDYMRSLGVSDIHAKGILANIQGESGFQTGVMGDNGMSGGLFQMYDDRYRKMEQAVPNWRMNWKGQIKHALQDDTAPQFLQIQFNSPEEAADWFLENYERPAMEHRPGRKKLNRSFIPNLGF